MAIATRITSDHVRQFHDEGWFAIEGALSPTELCSLQSECDRLIAERDEEMTRLGVDSLDLCHRGRRYFLHGYDTSAAVRNFVSSDIMTEVASAVLGGDIFLFNEQYVIKGAERGMSFSWHQDSGFIPYAHRPYLTCWIPLDDVSEANGTVHLLPYSRAGGRQLVEHRRDAATNDMVGYSGDDPGDVVAVPAGSILGFSSTVLHRTGPNRTDRPRRVFVAQYSSEPLLDDDGIAPRHLAVPLIIDGQPQTGLRDDPEAERLDASRRDPAPEGNSHA